MSMEREQAIGVVRDILRSDYPLLAEVPLDADSPLLSTGRLDSFALVTLIARLEEAFEIEIDVDELEIDHFETIDQIARLCLGSRPV